MKKVFIVHGFMSAPNGAWRPWLMGELNALGVYACALSMPSPYYPKCGEWIEEIARMVDRDNPEDIILVGHSLGCAAILKYLEQLSAGSRVGGVILVSGPAEKLEVDNPESKLRRVDDFFTHDFQFEKIKNTSKHFIIIHGDDDRKVPFEQAEKSSLALGGELVVVSGGGHLSGHNGFDTLPILLKKIKDLIKE